jgi:small-conductance mechanosensitive channel
MAQDKQPIIKSIESDSSQSEVKKSDTVGSSIQELSQGIKWNVSIGKIFWSLIIFLIAFLLIKYLTKALEAVGERWSNLRLLIKRIAPILRIGAWTFVLYLIIAGILAPPIETLIAVTASAGIAVGFASQDILKNIFGGIMILFDRPFQVGDKIQMGAHYGEVVQIGLRTVRIVTPDDSLVSIPNSEIVSQAVSNSNSGEFNCQVVAEFYLPANTDLVILKKIAYRAAAVSRYVYLKKPIAVIIKNEMHEGRSILKVRLKAYVLDLRYEFAFASEMTELVIQYLLQKKIVRPEELSFINSTVVRLVPKS